MKKMEKVLFADDKPEVVVQRIQGDKVVDVTDALDLVDNLMRWVANAEHHHKSALVLLESLLVSLEQELKSVVGGAATPVVAKAWVDPAATTPRTPSVRARVQAWRLPLYVAVEAASHLYARALRAERERPAKSPEVATVSTTTTYSEAPPSDAVRLSEPASWFSRASSLASRVVPMSASARSEVSEQQSADPSADFGALLGELDQLLKWQRAAEESFAGGSARGASMLKETLKEMLEKMQETVKSSMERLHRDVELPAVPLPFEGFEALWAAAPVLHQARTALEQVGLASAQLHKAGQCSVSLFKMLREDLKIKCEEAKEACSAVAPDEHGPQSPLAFVANARLDAPFATAACTKGRRARAAARPGEHQLPGDSLATKPFESRKNLIPFVFLPCFLAAWMWDGVVLSRETASVYANGQVADVRGMSSGDRTALYDNGTLACAWGKPAQYNANGDSFCPVVAGFSPMSAPCLWYGWFLLTIAFCYWRGRSMKRRCKNLEGLSAIPCYLDCHRALYTDSYWWVWFLAVTLCFIASVLARVVAAPPGGSYADACVRYGDWSGHWDQCKHGGALELTQLNFMLLVGLTCMAALLDQGSFYEERSSKAGLLRCLMIELGWRSAPEAVNEGEGDVELQGGGGNKDVELEYWVDPVTAAAMKTKALIRCEMYRCTTQRGRMTMSFVTDEVWRLFSWAAAMADDAGEYHDADGEELQHDFLDRLAVIMSELGDGPQRLWGETENFRLQLLGLPAPEVQEQARERLRRAVREAEAWGSGMVPVDLVHIYQDEKDVYRDLAPRRPKSEAPGGQEKLLEFTVGGKAIRVKQSVTLRALKSEIEKTTDSKLSWKAFRRQNKALKSAKDGDLVDMYLAAGRRISFLEEGRCSANLQPLWKGHTIMGILLGLLGFFFLSFVAPTGDAFTFTYDLVNNDAFIEARCAHHGARGLGNLDNPWCDLSSEKSMYFARRFWSRTMFTMYPDGGVVLCLVLKALAMVLFMCLFLNTVAKTMGGLDTAAQPMRILDRILTNWAQEGSASVTQIHVWKLVRDSILHNEVRNIMDRYENVVVAFVFLTLYFVADQTYYIAFLRRVPNVPAIFTAFVVSACAVMCVGSAMACYYAQEGHLQSLALLKEALVVRPGPEVGPTSSLIDQIVGRLRDGDYQIKMLYIPLNPRLQKAFALYLFSALVAVTGRFVFGS